MNFWDIVKEAAKPRFLGYDLVKAVSKNIEKRDKKIRNEGYQLGVQDTKAEHAVRLDKLEKRLKNALAKLKDSSTYFDAIIAMQAVAVAAAICDGDITNTEQETIELFIGGISQASLPIIIKNILSEMYVHPLNIKEAMVLAKKTNIEMAVFDELIQIVIHSDNKFNAKEKRFLTAWNKLKAA